MNLVGHSEDQKAEGSWAAQQWSPRSPTEAHRKGLPWRSRVKNLPCSAQDTGSIPGQGTKIPHVVEQLKPVSHI